MLLRIIYLMVFVSFTMLHSESTVRLTTDSTKITDFTLNYYVDKSGKMDIEEVQQQNFKEGKNRLSLGLDAHTTWVKLILKNEQETEKKLFIQNTYAYHASCISFYAFDADNRLLKQISFEPRKNKNTDLMEGAIASFTVVLKPHEEKTVYMKSDFLAYQIIELKIFDNTHAKENLVHEYMIIIILTTILFTLAGYYTILFLASRHKEYIYYTLYLLSSGIFIAYSYGMLTHYYHIYGKLTLYLNATILLSPIFLAQFVKTIFNTKKEHILENRLLNTLIALFVLLYLYSFMNYYIAMELASYSYLYLLCIMLFVGLSLYRKSVALIKYFIFAHLLYIAATIVALLFYHNMIVFTYTTSHAIALGTLGEAFLLAFLVSYRIRILEESNHEKDRMILTDMMTALYNKSYFEEALNSKLAIHRKQKGVLALFVIDIDYFKQYNDTYGHTKGDEVLRSVSKVLKDMVRDRDNMAFRIGGEEFSLICMESSKKNALYLAYTLKERIERLQILHEGSEVSKYLTVSIGIHFASTHMIEDAKKVFRYADEALYSAKKEGRNKVVVYGNVGRML